MYKTLKMYLYFACANMYKYETIYNILPLIPNTMFSVGQYWDITDLSKFSLGPCVTFGISCKLNLVFLVPFNAIKVVLKINKFFSPQISIVPNTGIL